MVTNMTSVRDYLRLIFRRKAVLIIPLILSAFLILPLFVIVPTKYRANALVKRQDLRMVERAGGDRAVSSGESVNTLKREILTSDNLDRVINQLKLNVDIKSQRDLQDKYEQLKKSIQISSVARAGGVELIQISALEETPDQAMQVANAIADNYVEESKKSSRHESELAVDFLRRRTQESLQKLKASNKQLEKFKKQSFEDIPQMKDRYLAKRAALREQQDSQRYILQATTSRIEQIRKQLKSTSETVVQETVKKANPDHQELKQEIIKREDVLELMLISYTEEHPEVVKMRGEIKRLKKRFAEMPTHVDGDEVTVRNTVFEELQKDLLKAEQEVKGMEAGLLGIQADLAVLDARIQQVREQETSYGDLVRERDGEQEQHARFSRQLTTAELEFDVMTSRYGTQVDMIQRALRPVRPDQQQRLYIALACLAGGCAAGVGLMFVVEFCDHSLRGVEDAAAFLPMPVLGSLTMIVSPAQIARRRFRNLVILASVILLLAMGAGGLFVWEHFNPGTISQLVEIARQLFQ